MRAPPVYRAQAQARELERTRQEIEASRRAAALCIKCGIVAPASVHGELCAVCDGKRKAAAATLFAALAEPPAVPGWGQRPAAVRAAARDLSAPIPPPFAHPRLDAKPASSRRRGAP